MSSGEGSTGQVQAASEPAEAALSTLELALRFEASAAWLLNGTRHHGPLVGIGAYLEAAARLRRQEAEIERMRDALLSIRKHCEPQPSALAAAIVATCDNGLGQPLTRVAPPPDRPAGWADFKTCLQAGLIAGDGKPCPNNHDPDCRWPNCNCRRK